MDNQERDLILDLVSGTLPEAEARALESGLSAEARHELELQRLAVAAIGDTPSAGLNDLERQRLHSAVAEGIKDTTREMHAAAVATPSRVRLPRRTVRRMRFAYGAAAAAVFVAAVGVGSQLDLGGDTSAASDTTSVAASDDEATRLGADAGGGDSFAGDGAETDTTAAAALTTTTIEASAEAAPPIDPPIAPPIDKAFELRDLGRIQAWVDSQVLSEPGALEEGADPTQLNCYANALEDLVVVAGFITPYRDQATNQMFDAVGFAADAGVDQDPQLRLYDPLTCELLSTTSP